MVALTHFQCIFMNILFQKATNPLQVTNNKTVQLDCLQCTGYFRPPPNTWRFLLFICYTRVALPLAKMRQLPWWAVFMRHQGQHAHVTYVAENHLAVLPKPHWNE